MWFHARTKIGRRKESVSKLLHHIQEKYKDDTFTCDFTDSYECDNKIFIFVKSEKYPDAKVQVCQRVVEEEKVVIEDNYMAYVYAEGIETEIGEVFKQIYGQRCNILYEPSKAFLISDGLEMDIHEYMASPYSNIHACVFIYNIGQDAEKNTQIERLRGLLKERKIVMGANILFSQDAAVLMVKADENEFFRYILNKDNADMVETTYSFQLNEEFHFTHLERTIWSDIRERRKLNL